jgi:hypothetical protein
MKIRNGFISNSSSTSFVIINAKTGYEELNPTYDDIYIVGASGESEFGWGPDTIYDIHSRINFAYLQAIVLKKEEMLEEIILKNSNIKKIEYSKNIKEGYIDHQSSASEEKNIEIFENKKNLKNFIFGKDSFIELDNDNH